MPDIRANHSGGDADLLAADRLDALWDDLVRTGSADLSTATDGDAARLSLISYAGLLVPRSDPASRERIRHRVFADYPEVAMRSTSFASPASAIAGHERMTVPRPRAARPRPRPWWRRSLGVLELAISAVLVLATIGGIALLRPDNEPEQLPAAVGSPNPAAGTPDVSEQVATGETLLRLDLGGRLNYTRLSVTISRVTLAPGARWTFAPDAFPVVNHPIDEYVESGTLTIGIGDTEYTVRSGRGPDLNGIPDYLSNSTSDPVVMLLAIAYRTDGSPPYPFTGATIEDIGTAEIPPFMGDIERIVTVVRARTADGPALLATPDQRPVFVAVESGTMQVRTAPDAEVTTSSFRATSDGPPGRMVVGPAPAEGVELGPGETLAVDDAYGITETEMVGDEELVTVSVNVRVRPDLEAAAGAVSPNSVTMKIPGGDGRVGFGLYRIVLGPLSSWWYDSDASLILQVVEGTISVSDGAGSTHTVEPGGPFTYNGRATIRIQTTSTGSAEVIAAVAYDEGNPPDMAGPEWSGSSPAVLLGSGSATLAPGDAQLTLSTGTLSLDPGSEVGTFLTNGANLVSILSGTVDVVRYGGQVTVFEDSIADYDGPAGEEHEYPFGVRATASYGDAIVAQPRSAYSLTAHGDESPVLATLSISSDVPIEMTTPGPRGDEPITFRPDRCQVDPRPTDDLRRIIEDPDDARIDPGLRDEASTGEAADAATAAELTETVRETLACSQYGTPLQGYALFTDNALLAGAVANGLTLKEINEMEQATPEEFPDEFVGTFAIDEISLFPDGQAGAWIFSSGELAYLTFVHDPETGRWLIDAWDDRERNESAPATPAA